MSVNPSAKKRRRDDVVQTPLRKIRKVTPDGNEDDELQKQIADIEVAIAEGEDTVANVSTLLSLVRKDETKYSGNTTLLVSLCKGFTRLMASGEMIDGSKNARLLREQYLGYHEILRHFVTNGGQHIKTTSMQLALRMLKAQAEHLGENIWSSKTFTALMETVFETRNGAETRAMFAQEYFKAYDDLAYYTLDFISGYASKPLSPDVTDNVLDVLSTLTTIPSSAEELNTFFTASSAKNGKNGKPIINPSSLRRAASAAWLATLSTHSLTSAHRKRLLNILVPTILPWLTRPETLFDFLTSCFDQGGTSSLLALSGMYHLISSKNLDYPSFYPKVYSLLTPALMYSKHRSRFLRHLQIFLSSTHLPATLIASFIKRMSRLSLYAPPAAIVAMVPYIYNLLKSHPQTTFMIHRTFHWEADKVYHDPFDANDPNPLTTDAISSSLWELHTLASPGAIPSYTALETSGRNFGHFHPNVSSLAQIICLQFTKQQYNLDDFLDHSYQSMLESELKRGEVKKEPVIEWKISKRMFIRDDKDQDDEQRLDLVRQLWTFK